MIIIIKESIKKKKYLYEANEKLYDMCVYRCHGNSVVFKQNKSFSVFLYPKFKMLKTRLNNKYTGIYRTQDDIDNLKIRYLSVFQKMSNRLILFELILE